MGLEPISNLMLLEENIWSKSVGLWDLSGSFLVSYTIYTECFREFIQSLFLVCYQYIFDIVSFFSTGAMDISQIILEYYSGWWKLKYSNTWKAMHGLLWIGRWGFECKTVLKMTEGELGQDLCWKSSKMRPLKQKKDYSREAGWWNSQTSNQLI